MADDEWEDTLVTSWTPLTKYTVFHVSNTTEIIVKKPGDHESFEITGILAPVDRAGFFTLLLGKKLKSLKRPLTRLVWDFDPQRLKLVDSPLDLSVSKHRVVNLESEIVSGYLSPDPDFNLLLLDSEKLQIGEQTFEVKLDILPIPDTAQARDEHLLAGIWGFTYKIDPEMTEKFKLTARGVVFVDHLNLLHELRGLQIIDYPEVDELLGFGVNATDIFGLTRGMSEYQLVRLDRQTQRRQKFRSLAGFNHLKFECMQVFQKYIVICFKDPKDRHNSVSNYQDHKLVLLWARDPSFMKVLDFSECGFFPPKLQTVSTRRLFAEMAQSSNQNHMPFWPSMSYHPLSESEESQLRLRQMACTWSRVTNFREMLIFPFGRYPEMLVVALRDRSDTIYLFSISQMRLQQCDTVSLFKKLDKGQFRMYPTPNRTGILAISTQGTIQVLSLTPTN